MTKEPFSLTHVLFGSINKKLTIIFFLVAIAAPTIGIYYFYSISISLLTETTEIFHEQMTLLQTTAALIIIMIAFDAGIIGFYVSRSISKPLLQLHEATQELEKGNFLVRTDITTNDELAQLSHAFNNTATALSKMNEQREQIDRAKSEFLSITSHELRTPLTPMKVQLQMLEKGYFGRLTKKQKESVVILKRNAERLNRIIEDFLEVSRIEAARLKFVFKETDLAHTLQETVAFLDGFAKEKQITLAVRITNLPSIHADSDRISQVLRNLIHNAIKFSPQGSTIMVSAEAKPDHILFGIKDQGVGMSSEDQIRVFEPFYQIEATVNRQHGGTGLGLTICRGIIEAQKGKIWVDSKQGMGSTFYFTVPLTPVVEIEPIKVLFSSKEHIEKKIEAEFTTILGPMGTIEFSNLKQKHALGKDDLLHYIHSLEELSILHPEQEQEFEQHILAIFGEEKK
ncbi:MAG: HAMP domain-containing sensor histidine kinase [Methanobacteriota archaeon]